MKRIINLALIIMTLTQAIAPAVQAESRTDLVIPVRFVEDTDGSGIEDGNAIPLEITQDIYVDGKLPFKQGGAGYAEIADIKHASFLGRGGKITIRTGRLIDIKRQSHDITLSANASGDQRLSAVSGTLIGSSLGYELAREGILTGTATGALFAVGVGIIPIAYFMRKGQEARLSCGKIMFARLS
jgi:sulfite reductase beta subunit-like hemoprotein